MKVYIVFHLDDCGTPVAAVKSTEEAAKKLVAELLEEIDADEEPDADEESVFYEEHEVEEG